LPGAAPVWGPVTALPAPLGGTCGNLGHLKSREARGSWKSRASASVEAVLASSAGTIPEPLRASPSEVTSMVRGDRCRAQCPIGASAHAAPVLTSSAGPYPGLRHASPSGVSNVVGGIVVERSAPLGHLHMRPSPHLIGGSISLTSPRIALWGHELGGRGIVAERSAPVGHLDMRHQSSPHQLVHILDFATHRPLGSRTWEAGIVVERRAPVGLQHMRHQSSPYLDAGAREGRTPLDVEQLRQMVPGPENGEPFGRLRRGWGKRLSPAAGREFPVSGDAVVRETIRERLRALVGRLTNQLAIVLRKNRMGFYDSTAILVMTWAASERELTAARMRRFGVCGRVRAVRGRCRLRGVRTHTCSR
jgi:hypothetical protein